MNKNIRLARVTKEFSQGDKTLTILSDCSFQFDSGQSYAITGASGTGKSTLMHLLAGLDRPTRGVVSINGTNLETTSHEQRAALLNTELGCVFQEPLLIQELSVIENVMLKELIAGKSRAACVDYAQELLGQIGLTDKAHEHPRSLSGGQQQRVAILRAIFNKPTFLLADEPTGNLDETTGRAIVDLLLECQKQWGVGLIIASHDPYVADAMGSVLNLHAGVLAARTQLNS